MTDIPKGIDTLIEDVYSVLTDGYNKTDDNEKVIDAFGEGLKDLLRSRLSPRGPSNGLLRLSGIGKPARQLWYDSRGYDREALTGDKLLKFLYGDIIEEILLTLAKLSGHSVTHEQQVVKVAGITGHMDAVIDGHVVDVKSASPFAFKKFERATLAIDDPFGYMQQISAYTEAVPDSKGSAFWAMNKVDGNLTLYQPSPSMLPDTTKRVEYLKGMLEEDSPPERCYDVEVDFKTSNEKLSIGCVFCDFKKECWKDANEGEGLKGYKYAAMPFPLYLTKIVKAPRVDEIDIA
jgi:hypothetical protein|tara:strand:+ start:4055 stop:4927 length:873 start_codon:yes stop_codon:yes gene_type:complete